jgi:hypothetical protein
VNLIRLLNIYNSLVGLCSFFGLLASIRIEVRIFELRNFELRKLTLGSTRPTKCAMLLSWPRGISFEVAEQHLRVASALLLYRSDRLPIVVGSHSWPPSLKQFMSLVGSVMNLLSIFSIVSTSFACSTARMFVT